MNKLFPSIDTISTTIPELDKSLNGDIALFENTENYPGNYLIEAINSFLTKFPESKILLISPENINHYLSLVTNNIVHEINKRIVNIDYSNNEVDNLVYQIEDYLNFDKFNLLILDNAPLSQMSTNKIIELTKTHNIVTMSLSKKSLGQLNYPRSTPQRIIASSCVIGTFEKEENTVILKIVKNRISKCNNYVIKQ